MLRKTNLRLLSISLACSFLLAGCNKPRSEVRAIPRQDFNAAVFGKSTEEVIAAVGRPERTTDSDKVSIWFYTNNTIDPVTGKIGDATLFFADGRVDKVIF